MRNIAELALRWSGPPVLQEDIHSLQAHFNVTLPSDYLHFLSLANGGPPKSNCYDYVHEDSEQGQVIVGDLHYMTADREDLGGVWKNTQSLLQYMDISEAMRSKNVVAVGRDGSINPIYLDLSITPASVRILYVDDELLDYKIADSFEQFIDGLQYVDFSK